MKKIFVLILVPAFIACAPKTDSSDNKKAGLNSDSLHTHVQEKVKPSAEELEQYFDRQKNASQVIVQAKGIPANGEGVYCYFRMKGERASKFRFRIQYWDAKYADADLYRFDVDGKTYEYMANNDKSPSGSSHIANNTIFYWYDKGINKEDQAFLEALAQSENATISLVDRAVDKSLGRIILSQKQKEDIGRTLDYYFALDGATIPRKGMVNIRD